MYEAMSEVYKVMIPVIEKNHDYKKLANIYRFVDQRRVVSSVIQNFLKISQSDFFFFFFLRDD